MSLFRNFLSYDRNIEFYTEILDSKIFDMVFSLQLTWYPLYVLLVSMLFKLLAACILGSVVEIAVL